jgi:hypothetical protein
LAALKLKAPVHRYQREFLHLDIKKLVRFEGAGHRITENRRGKSSGGAATADKCRQHGSPMKVLFDEKRQFNDRLPDPRAMPVQGAGVEVERFSFIQTMLREQPYAIPFKSSHTRAADPSRRLSWYNKKYLGPRQAIPLRPSPNNLIRSHSLG